MYVKEIPGTMGFTVSLTGEVFDKNNIQKKEYCNLDGYKTTSVLNTQGKWQTFGVHRLIALAYISYIGDVTKLTVNHINGNVQDNCVAICVQTE
jgi:hypothetical protein